MAQFCANCGKPLEEDAHFCIFCGAPVGGFTPKTEPKEEEARQELHTGYLIWSIINMLVGVRLLGLIGLIFTLAANNTPVTRAKGYLKVAKILNLVSSIAAGALYGFMLLLILFVVLFSFLMVL